MSGRADFVSLGPPDLMMSQPQQSVQRCERLPHSDFFSFLHTCHMLILDRDNSDKYKVLISFIKRKDDLCMKRLVESGSEHKEPSWFVPAAFLFGTRASTHGGLCVFVSCVLCGRLFEAKL